MQKKIRVILPRIEGNKKTKHKILKVAVYCRVSKNTPEQLQSLEMQEVYFEKLVNENHDWELYKIYKDVGSGTRRKGRDGYIEMLKDAQKHRFDLILVKSLSRFGRNIVETLSTIRRLKKMNIAMLSDVEQINTMEVNEVLLSILLAAAQEESAAKSENIKFGIRQRMRSGKAVLNHTRFLGYTKDEDGRLVVVPEEAEIVRKIFSLYLAGYGVRKIKRYLEGNGIKTVTGKSEWSTSTIDRMLSNEKYMGNLLLQKTCTPDFLTGKQKKNCGEQSMFLVENAHEPIVSKEIFEDAQRRKHKM